MKILQWMNLGFSKRHKALSIYKRGMAKAQKQDHRGALADYTTVIDMADAPRDVAAMALYNRALVYTAVEEVAQGTEDLRAVIEMPEAPEHIKTEARRRLARLQKRDERKRQGP